MPDFAICAQHPDHPSLLVGIHLDAFDITTATDQAFHLCHSYRVPGLFFPEDPATLSTRGTYLVTYNYNGTTCLTTIQANSQAEALRLMAHLTDQGTIIYPDQPIA